MAEQRNIGSASEADLIDLRDVDAEGLRRAFVSLASHELRTPVTSIRGFVSVLLTWWEVLPDDQKLEHLGVIESQTRHLSRLIDRLLMMTELDAGLLRPKYEHVQLRRLIAESLGELGERRRDAVVTGEDVVLRVDGDLVKETLLAILDNAFKHGRPPVTVRVSTSDSVVEIRIEDEGDGVPATFGPALFDRFLRPDAKHRASGLGLSLAVACELTHLHGGDLWLEPRDAGACFVICLPVAPGPSSEG